MKTDFLIIGQGISGTFLSWYLQQAGKQVMVIDQFKPDSPSRIAAGIINPVTGRRLVTVWRVGEIHPFAAKAYSEIGAFLGIEAISQKTVIDFFPNPFMREGFLEKISSGDQYVHAFPEQNHFNTFFNYEFGCGEIRPAYTAHMEVLLPAWRAELMKQDALREEAFDPDQLELTADGIRYQDIEASKIIFCDGANSAQSSYFKNLPFAANKGEALVVRIPGLPPHHIYKKSMMLVPMVDEDIFWIGSSYEWDFESLDPSPEFREKTERLLKDWLKIPFEILEHRSGMRPATLERRPFVGLHPVHPQIGILNGMGTKGCSLAPFFASQLADHLTNETPIAADADIARFKKVLTRPA